MATKPRAAYQSVMSRITWLTPKISCMTTIPGPVPCAGKARYAAQAAPSRVGTVTMGMQTSPLHCAAARLWHKEPVRHCFYRRWSGLPGPPRFIDLGDREVTPGAIHEAQVEGIAIERCSAGCGAHGFIEIERW